MTRSTPNSERMWCTACGTVTADGICDCNRWSNEMSREPNFVNYADAMQQSARELSQELERAQKRVEELEGALRPFTKADWYAAGRGKFEGLIHGDDLDAAKAILADNARNALTAGAR